MKTIVGSLLAVTALLIGSASAQTGITVSMTNYAFTPSTLTLKAGETYRIHFSNASGKYPFFRKSCTNISGRSDSFIPIARITSRCSGISNSAAK